MTGPRIAVFAFSDVGHACLGHLLEKGENVVSCYTYSEPPGASGWPPSVAELARSRGVPFRTDVDWGKAAEVFQARALSPDLIFSFYYRDILPPAVLGIPRLGAWNVHGSLLPKYRGRAPVNWAVLEGATETGATLHAMTPEVDSGDIVDAEKVEIGPDETAFEVQRKVVGAAVRVLERQLENLKAGRAPRRPQDPGQAFSRGRRRPEDGEIEWNQPVQAVHNLVRAVTHPYPGAFTDAFGGKTYLWKSRVPGLAAHDSFPGRVHVERGRLYVCCGDDRFLEILALQREGKSEVSAEEWIQSP